MTPPILHQGLAACRLAGPFAALLAALLVADPAGATVGPPARLDVSQVVAQGRDISLYVSVRDAAGVFVPGLAAEQFAATIGRHRARVAAVAPFAETGEGVAYLFLVDTSASLSPTQFGQIRGALGHWVERLEPADRAGLVRFGETVQVLVEPTADAASLTDALAPLAATDRFTALHGALLDGIALARRGGADLPPRRVLVTLTDGIDDRPGLASAREVEEALATDPVPLYAVGFAGARVPAAGRRRGLDALGAFARRSGGALFDATASNDPAAGLAALRAHIGEVYRVQLSCAECELDGARHPLHLTLSADEFQIPADASVRLLPGHDALVDPDAPESPGTIPTDIDEPAPDATVDDPDTPETDRPEAAETRPSDEDETAPDTAHEPAMDPAATAESTPETTADPRAAVAAWVPGLTGAVLALGLLLWLVVARRRRGARSVRAEPAPGVDAQTSPEPRPAPDRSPPAPWDLSAPGSPPPATGKTIEASPLPPSGRDQPPAVRLRLAWIKGPRAGEQVTLTLRPRVRIGRARDCELVLAGDPEISARHAELLALDAGRVVVRDLGSTNGTRLNGVPLVGVHPVADGDLIAFGNTECRVGL